MPKQFFRVDGADQQTGEETYLVLQAPTKPQAEKLARQQGLLISSVRVARPDDWGPPPPAPEEEPVPDIETTQYIEPGMYTLPPAPAEPEVSGAAVSEPHYAPTPEPEPFVDSAPAAQAQPTYTVEASPVSAPSNTNPAGGSAAAMILACAGGALVIGGVLALVLALWPDNALRNEIQQIDFRLHELSQTILGSMLVLGGLVVFAVAVICYLVPRRK